MSPRGWQNRGVDNTRAVRVIRGASAASVATLAALLTHLAAGGAMPAALGVFAAWTLTLLVSTALAGRRLSLLRLSLAVATSQLVFHALFVFGAVGAGTLAIDPHAHHLTMLPALPAGTLSALQADAAMWIWHGLAAVVTVALIHRGERTAAQVGALAREIAAWTRRALERPTAAPTVPARRPAPLGITSVTLRTALRLADCVQRRGPPAVITL